MPKVPQTEEEWIRISEEFEEKWNFPNCLGALDGKHIQINDLLIRDIIISIIKVRLVLCCLHLSMLTINLYLSILVGMEELAMGELIEMQHYSQHWKITL